MVNRSGENIRGYLLFGLRNEKRNNECEVVAGFHFRHILDESIPFLAVVVDEVAYLGDPGSVSPLFHVLVEFLDDARNKLLKASVQLVLTNVDLLHVMVVQRLDCIRHQVLVGGELQN